jgi:hypothetical protein
MLGREHHLNVTSQSVAAKSPLTMQRLWRQALWGSAAAAALLVAILSGRSDVGGQRAASIFSFLKLTPILSQSSQAAPHAFDAESATRQLAQAVRGLTDATTGVTIAAMSAGVIGTGGALSGQGETWALAVLAVSICSLIDPVISSTYHARRRRAAS